MQGESVDPANLLFSLADNFFKEAACPFAIVSVWTGCNEGKFLPESRDPGCVPPVLHRIFLRGEVAAASPGLVANPPITDIEWLFETSCRTLVGRGGASCRRVAIFDPAIELFCREAAHIGGKVGLPTNQTADLYKFICAEQIGIVTVTRWRGRRITKSPEIGSPRAFLSRTDAITPGITIGKAAAGQAHDRR